MTYKMMILIQCSILLLSTWLPATESNIEQTNYSYERNVPPVIVSETRINLCDFFQTNAKVRCYCEYGGEEDDSMNSPIKADCWVMNGTVRNDDPVWNAFSAFPKLERLSFTLKADTTIDFIPKSAFRHLKSIKNINIKYANVKLVEAHTFENLPTLENIDLSRNDIEEITPFAFSNLNNVTVISIDDNHISEIKRDVFHNLPALKNLYITNNNINIIHDDAFKHMPNLLELEVDRNVIFVLTRATFKGLGKLTLLALNNNKIEMLGDHTFAEMPNLEDLSLDNNNIQLITDKAFFGLQKLKRLSMSDNKLTTLTDPLVFADLKSLISLDLRFTALKTLPYDVVKPILPNMWGSDSMIYLEGNDFDCNCHIDWMVDLHNKSTSNRIHIGFQEFTCNIDPTLGKEIKEKILAMRAAREQIEMEQENNDRGGPPYGDEDYYEEEYEPQEEAESSPKSEIVNKMHFLDIPSGMMPCDEASDKSEITMKNEILAQSSSIEVNLETTTPTSPATKIDEVSAKPKLLKEIETSQIYPNLRKGSSSNMMINSIPRSDERITESSAIEAEIPDLQEEPHDKPFVLSESYEEVIIRTEAPSQSPEPIVHGKMKEKNDEKLNEEPSRFTQPHEVAEESVKTVASLQPAYIKHNKIQKINNEELNEKPLGLTKSAFQSANIKDNKIQNLNEEEFTADIPPQIEKADLAFESKIEKETYSSASTVSMKSWSSFLFLMFLSRILCYV